MKFETIVNALLGALAGSAIAIGTMFFAFGPHATAGFFAPAFNFLGADELYLGGLERANPDSEIRFMSVFWAGFGIWVLSQLRAGTASRTWVVAALALFWTGGLGRLLSIWQTGQWPDSLFVALMWIELLSPPVVFILHLMSQRNRREVTL